MLEMSPEAAKAADLIVKLLAKSQDSSVTPEEAAAFAAKAQDLLIKFNLSADSLYTDKREKFGTKIGGAYDYQRWLWNSVAKLNFCLYRVQEYRVTFPNGMTSGKRYRHLLIGRTVNVKSTVVMAEYIEQAIERIRRQHQGNDTRLLLSNWAHSFRKGAITVVVGKLRERRDRVLAEEAAKAPKSTGGTALVLQSYTQSEIDANTDILLGDGASAQHKASLAKYEELRAAEEAWALANPEEAAKKKAAEEAAWEKERKRNEKDPWVGMNITAYLSGAEAGKEINLDPQIDESRTKRLM